MLNTNIYVFFFLYSLVPNEYLSYFFMIINVMHVIPTGIHAREWITPATVTYFLNKILTTDDPAFKELVESFNYYIFPSINPDGYVYSHTMVSKY